MIIRSTLSGLLCIFLVQAAPAAEPHTEHTFRLEKNESAPAATLDDARWLAGSWTGSAFGQRFEQVWNPASAGSMVGMFKLMDGDKVSFYEILLITVEDGTLSLKVKHFNPNFTAWEEKEGYVDFRLVHLEEDALHFKGLSFYRRGDDQIDGYIVMSSGAEIREEALRYKRVH